MKVEPNVRRLLREKGVDVRLMARAVDVVLQNQGTGHAVAAIVIAGSAASGIPGETRRSNTEPFDNGDMRGCCHRKTDPMGNPAGIGGDSEQTIEGDVFVETTGSTGPMGNCLTYGNGVACVSSDARHLVLGSVSVQEPITAAISWSP